MNEEEVKQLIKDSLKIEIYTDWDYGDLSITVKLFWNKEEIESDTCFINFPPITIGQ